MTVHDDLAAVVRLACLTEDRTGGEQKAMIAIAWRLDIDHNTMSSANAHARKAKWEPWDLVQLVLDTRVLGDGDKEIAPPSTRGRRWETWKREGGFAPADG